MNIFITERDGAVSVETSRRLFESSVRNTPSLKKAVSLDPMEKNGKFVGYKDKEADAIWVGFAIGLRMSDRVSKMQFGERLDYDSVPTKQ